ncbi:MarR family transcriptional regulator [Arthrobacter sp. zg-Y826]|uniref:sugar-binding transcriptional regulator n=1 Tax=Arthrobacter jinronghuae TaxID=2964609 RepID=UPI00210790FD|nr:sugar-binding domain-containing protein [Arthrobacter jinronghuae]MCQ1956805.1 MarR family transcriptional regulator [Arthrobacter jinronghuae]
MYYLQSLTMEAIARELRISRSTVSRLLSYARSTGLVRIEIRNPSDRAPALEQEIASRFRIQAHVVPVAETVSPAQALQRVAVQAAHLIGPLIDSDAIIGVAWGSTLTAVSQHLPIKNTHDSTIVQMNGAGNFRTSGITYASEILQRFGHAYGARVVQFPVPAFFDHAETKEAMWRERPVRRVLDLQARMNTAIFGVGSMEAGVPSHVYNGAYLDEEDLHELMAEGVVGDVATMFYRADGTWDGIKLNYRSTGPDLSTLRQVPRRICVVAGETKTTSLLGALRAGLVTDLILDENSARRLASS